MSAQSNIQLILNGYTSMIRNVYLILSISIALFSFSTTFKTYKKLLQILAFIIICYTIVDGIIISLNFNNIISHINQLKLSELDKLLINTAKSRVYFVCISLIMFMILASIILLRKLI
jgi:hypothetical protein